MQMKMKELPESERPYEKLEMYGPSVLSNAELLAIIIKTGTKEDTSVSLAQKILAVKSIGNTEGLRFLQDISIQEFMSIKGIGKVKAIQIKAAGELAKRMSRPIHAMKTRIKYPQDIADLLMAELRYEKREVVKVIILNIKNEIQKIIDIALGGTNFAVIEPREVLVEAIKMSAPKIILVHNHPSGDPTPSKGDYLVTDKMIEASEIMGIQVLDHIVIGNNTYESIFTKKANMGKYNTAKIRKDEKDETF